MKEQTEPFWDAFERGDIIVIVSDVLKKEVDDAPQRVRDVFSSFPKSQDEDMERRRKELAKRQQAESENQ